MNKKIILKNKLSVNRPGTILSIEGPWGVGKTFFWNEFIEEQIAIEEANRHMPVNYKNNDLLTSKRYAYISLFGIESIRELKVKLALELLKNKFIAKDGVSKFWTTTRERTIEAALQTQLKAVGISIPSNYIIEESLFSIIDSNLICFDDLERKSKKLEIKEFLGFLTNLRDIYNCRVVIIYHKNKIKGEDLDIYKEYQEKVVDYSLYFDDICHLLTATIDFEREADQFFIKKFSDGLEIKNLRFFKKSYQLYLDLLHFYKSHTGEDLVENLKEILLFKILESSYFVYISDSARNIDISSMKLKRAFGQNIEKTLGEEEREKLKDVSSHLNSSDDLSNLIFDYVERNKINSEDMKNIINEINENRRLYEGYERLRGFNNKIDRLDINKDFPNLFFCEVLGLIDYLSLNDISYYAYLLSIFSEDKSINLINSAKRMIDGVFESNNLKRINFWKKSSIENSELKDYLNNKISEYDSEENIVSILKNSVMDRYIDDCYKDRIVNLSNSEWEAIFIDIINNNDTESNTKSVIFNILRSIERFVGHDRRMQIEEIFFHKLNAMFENQKLSEYFKNYIDSN